MKKKADAGDFAVCGEKRQRKKIKCRKAKTVNTEREWEKDRNGEIHTYEGRKEGRTKTSARQNPDF